MDSVNGFFDWFGGPNSVLQQLWGGYTGQNAANAFNADQAQKQMDFQNRESSSAYTRSMDDMKNAGLNPMMMMAQGGGPESSPSGAMASAAQPHDPTSMIQGISNSAQDFVNMAKDLQVKDSQIGLNIANAGAATAKTGFDSALLPIMKKLGQFLGNTMDNGTPQSRGIVNYIKSLNTTNSGKVSEQGYDQNQQKNPIMAGLKFLFGGK